MKTLVETCLLSFEQIAFLKIHSPPQIFNSAEDLVYQGQIPLAGYVLLEGKITLEKKNKPIENVPLNSMILVRELLNSAPIRSTVKIHPASKVLILDKTSIFEMMLLPEGEFFKESLPA